MGSQGRKSTAVSPRVRFWVGLIRRAWWHSRIIARLISFRRSKNVEVTRIDPVTEFKTGCSVDDAIVAIISEGKRAIAKEI